MKRSLENALKREFEGSVFVRNIGWFWAGAVLSIAGLVISALLLPDRRPLCRVFRGGLVGHLVGRDSHRCLEFHPRRLQQPRRDCQIRFCQTPSVSDSLWHRRCCGSHLCDFLRCAVAGHRHACEHRSRPRDTEHPVLQPAERPHGFRPPGSRPARRFSHVHENRRRGAPQDTEPAGKNSGAV